MTVFATTERDASAIITINGDQRKVIGTDLSDARTKLLNLVIEHAARQGEPQRFVTTDPDGSWTMLVHPDGSVDADPDDAMPPMTEPEPEAVPSVVSHARRSHAADAQPVEAVTQVEPVTPAGTRMERRSFLQQQQVEKPATKGWRGTLTRAGLRLNPGPAERAEREDIRAVSRHWPGPRTVSVLNGKGGVGKTLATINLSATFARNGGSGVLAWDNNQTRGTLGWSTEQGPHESTILDLLPQVERFLGPGAQGSDLAHFVHHQTTDKFDVLRSKPEVLATEQRFDDATVDQIHQVASKFYRLIFVDSGNDETDPLWLRAVELSQQIVVPTIVEAKAAESAALLLESLAARGGHFAQLAANAVVVVSKHKHDLSQREVNDMAEQFRAIAREVVVIPYDPALGADMLSYDGMRPETQRAWLAAAAAIGKAL